MFLLGGFQRGSSQTATLLEFQGESPRKATLSSLSFLGVFLKVGAPKMDGFPLVFSFNPVQERVAGLSSSPGAVGGLRVN